MSTFEPAAWYWMVGGSTTQVYSSSTSDYVALGSSVYQQWIAAGNRATVISDEISLGQVLAQYSLRPAPAAVLDGYTSALASGIVVQAYFKVLFNHENRLRACERALGLNGSPPNLTLQQALAAVKALM